MFLEVSCCCTPASGLTVDFVSSSMDSQRACLYKVSDIFVMVYGCCRSLARNDFALLLSVHANRVNSLPLCFDLAWSFSSEIALLHLIRRS